MARCWNIRPWAVVWLLTLCVPWTGCAWKGGRERQAESPAGSNGVSVWRLVPWSMRVYPSTRFTVQDTGWAILEARIELTDEMGDSVKGIGRFRLELFSRGPAGSADTGQRLYSWNVATTSLADQRRYYDPITRAYLFRLKLDETDTFKRDSLLKVLFTASDGSRLEAQAPLPINAKTFGELRSQ